MVRDLERRTMKTVILFAALATICACSRPTPQSSRFSTEGFSGELPSGWKEDKGMETPLWLRGPETEGAEFPTIALDRAIDRQKRAASRAVVEDFLKLDKSTLGLDPTFSSWAVKEISVDGRPAWEYSISYLNTSQRAIHMLHGGPPPVDVNVRITNVYFQANGRAWEAMYSAPVSLYDKYRPTFDRFLADLRLPPPGTK